MTAANAGFDYATPRRGSDHSQVLFWGCFLALVTTAFGFISRMFLEGTFASEFGLDPAQTGELLGIGIWPFAASIIFFSLVIDKIGYKVSMMLAFAGHIIWAVMGYMAYTATKNGDPTRGYNLVYWGSLILALANGTVEAFINPVVATIFSREKTKWLNILHAGWPGGLVVAGIITIFMGNTMPWGYKLAIIAAPAVIYFIMLIGQRFPVQERVASGVSYRDMLAEFGTLGAIIVAFLVTLQLIQFFEADVKAMPALRWVFIGIGIAMVVAFAAYTRAAGRMLMFVLTLIMIPLAITEIGTDGWITGIMSGVVEDIHPGWILVYTSVIMMVLRFFAGPIVHSLSPLGLLTVSAALAIAGLYFLSRAEGVMIIVAATLYALGKTFFWPTMLGVVSEQTPRGGALTLNAISGIGMLAVGVLGFPYIGALQADKEIDRLAASEVGQQVPGLIEGGQLTTTENRSIYEIIEYKAISETALNARLDSISDETERERIREEVATVRERSKQGALANMAIFPAIMLGGYLLLLLYFRSRGGYSQVHLDAGHGGGGKINPATTPADQAVARGQRGPAEY